MAIHIKQVQGSDEIMNQVNFVKDNLNGKISLQNTDLVTTVPLKASQSIIPQDDKAFVTKGYVDDVMEVGLSGLPSLAPLDSPVFTGIPQAPTPSLSSNDTTVATTAFVDNKIQNFADTIIEGLSTALDTSLSDSADAVALATAISDQLDEKQDKHAALTSISNLTTSANKMIYTTAKDTYAVTSVTDHGRSLINTADAAATRSLISAPSTTGEGASGTWNITAANATTAATTTGNAGTATTLETPRTISISDNSGTNTATGTSFNGSKDITLKMPATIAASLTGTATNATADAKGNVIDTTYETKANAITYMNIDGTALTYKKGNGNTYQLNTQDTHYVTKLIAGNATATVNSAVSSGNVNLRLFDDTTHRSTIQLKGAGATTITSDANGVITISSTDTNSNTDTLVDQNVSTANATYPVLLTPTANASTNQGAQTAIFATNVKINPSTNVISASGFQGPLTGNVTGNVSGTASNVTGVVAVANGGTGLTSSPSMLVDLESTTEDDVLKASPRPGITGILPVENGGTGEDDLAYVHVGEASSVFFYSSYETDIMYLVTGAVGMHMGSLIMDNRTEEGGYLALEIGHLGTEAIYARQKDVINSKTYTATLLDANHNTTFPGTVTAASFSGTVTKALQDAEGNAITTTYAKLASPALTGTPTAPTAEADTDTDQIATTAFVNTAIENLADDLISGLSAAMSDSLSDTSAANALATAISDQLDEKQDKHAALTSISGLTTSADKMIYTTASNTYSTTPLTSTARSLLDDTSVSAMRTTLSVPARDGTNASGTWSISISGLAAKATADAGGNTITTTYAKLASPALTGTPTAPTATAGTNTTQVATTAFVKTAVDTAVTNLLGSAPAALDTLNELAAALGNDPNFATTIATSLGNKQPLHAALTSISELSTAADKMIYTTESDTYAVTTLTSKARELLDDADIATMRQTLSVPARDGSNATGTWSIGITGNAATATKIIAEQTVDGVSFDGSSPISHYCVCSTAEGTAAKTATLTGFSLVTGAKISVKFTKTNTAANPTLNVNNTGAKAIYYRDAAITAGYLAANRTYTFVYNGSQYELIGDINTNTTYSAATTSTDGLMSSSDKTKLNGIQTGATAVSISRNLTSGTKIGTITINGTGTDLYCQTNTNTDTLMTQTVSTTNATYPLLATATANATQTATTTAVFATGVKLNPSTGVITATGFSGPLTGNVTGNVSGSAGSATNDSAGQQINTTYIKGLSVNGTTITYTKGDNTTGTVTVNVAASTDTQVNQNVSTTNATYPILATPTADATTDQGAKTAIFASGIKINPSTNTISATTFVGNVTGNVSGSAGSCTGNAATATKATQDGSGNTITSTYAKLSGATFTGGITGTTATFSGTLTLTKTQDLSGTANSGPALVVGGTATSTHIEIDANEIHAKATGTTVAPLYLNNEGGQVNIGTGGLKVNGDIDATGKTVTATTFSGKATSAGTADSATKATQDGSGNTITSTYATKAQAVTGFSVDGTTVTFTRADGTTGTFVTQDTNTDTNTHYTTHLYAGTSTGTANASTTNGNTYLILTDDSTARNRVKLVGSGGTTVTSDANGNITISSTTSTPNTDTLMTQTVSTTNNTYPLLATATANATATATTTAVFASGVKLNPSTGTISATAFTGNLTGNVTGNVSGSSGSCTGNAATATALETANTIDGIAFNGSTAVSRYAVCDTGSNIWPKDIYLPSYTSLVTGLRVTVKFANTDMFTTKNAALRISSRGAGLSPSSGEIDIYYRGAPIPHAALQANSIYDMIYDGEHFEIIGSVVWGS